MYGDFQKHLQNELAAIDAAGLYKRERNIASQQFAEITLEDGSKALNFCANNYLGLSNNPRLMKAAQEAMEARGFGMSSVRFICGTQDYHKTLEKAIADYFKTEDTILYAACFDANGGLFETLLTAEDAIISDELNHASIIEFIRCFVCGIDVVSFGKAGKAETLTINDEKILINTTMEIDLTKFDSITKLRIGNGLIAEVCYQTKDIEYIVEKTKYGKSLSLSDKI